MIGYLKGEVIDFSDNKILLVSGGVGFNVNVPAIVCEHIIRYGREISLYTHMSVREDDISLYGFLSKDELDLYKQLISISGIGPKAGLSILSKFSPDELKFAIISEDVKKISSVPGLGNKTAQKVILELKDKISVNSIIDTTNNVTINEDISINNVRNEAVMALVALGYSNQEATRAISKIKFEEDTTVEKSLKEALKQLI